ncbi:uncharacterized protein LOC100377777 [Saccoglossus kowalevskii]|uniref:Glutaredoxin-like n=1 Tax=Saccoglossus kowalevskii TaxID=10224 RepID=A0ABM0GQA3_SACKO|nr:PREDICTED: glutaredoxin-like [Saccoglossus kowalevskii]
MCSLISLSLRRLALPWKAISSQSVIPFMSSQRCSAIPAFHYRKPIMSSYPRHYSNYTLDLTEVKKFVDAKIQEHKVVVFSKSYCPYCTMAKTTLDKYPISMEVIEIEDRPDAEEIQDHLNALTGGRSVPRVFINGKYIGGGSETTQFDRQGKLELMLKEAGAL